MQDCLVMQRASLFPIRQPFQKATQTWTGSSFSKPSSSPSKPSSLSMASHQIAIAKASFSAGLLRPDPTSVPRDEITAFHSSLDRALSQCSSTNIQTCKLWLLNHVALSSNRVGVLGKYLVALSASFVTTTTTTTTKGELEEKKKGELLGPVGNNGRRETSAKRKRLHILYLLNDLFHHAKYHSDTAVGFSTLSGSLQPYVVELLGYASSYDRQKNPKHHRRLDDLLDIWDDHGYYGHDYVKKLREVVKNSALTGTVKASVEVEQNSNSTDSGKKFDGRNVPFVMPSTHGDPSTPYYDLPAGNLVPHMIPNSTVPLRPNSIRPLQFLAGPADEKLVTALKAFLGDVDRIYGSGENDRKRDDGILDIDELGQPSIRDEVTGDIINGETYYGWSREFCQQMKKRNAADPYLRSRSSRSRSYSRSPSPSRSRSRSRSISRYKRRRRYSDSLESDDSRRSRSRRGMNKRYASYSRSPSPPPRRRQSRSPSREESYSPRPASPRPASPPPRSFPPRHNHQYGAPSPSAIPPPPPGPRFYPSSNNSPPPPSPQQQQQQQQQQQYASSWTPGMVSTPEPPSRPSQYNGPWPPPPPPLPTMGFPLPGPGMNIPSAFPAPFSGQSGQFLQPPPFPLAAQLMPPGSYHFPPPHYGTGDPGPAGRHGDSWGHPGTGGSYGRGWR